jgi:serine/threonine protein kinase
MATVDHKMVTEQFVAKLMLQILSGLAACHSKGFIHRDINTENVVFGDKENTILKLIDFGFAQIFDATNNKFQGVCGSPIYIAPEVLRKAPYAASSDIWSAGIICYFLLSGEFPYKDAQKMDMANLCNTIKAKTITMSDMKDGVWKGISNEAKDFILSMLDKDPAKRKTAQVLLATPWITKASDQQINAEDVKASLNNLMKNHVKINR